MDFKSKFDSGQHIWVVSTEEAKQKVRCLTCESSGRVMIGSEEFICPKCNGTSKHIQYRGHRYFILYNGVVGKIAIEYQTLGYHVTPEPEVKYMIDSTGVGSGNVWKEEQCFPTREDAQAFCDKMNSTLPQDEE